MAQLAEGLQKLLHGRLNLVVALAVLIALLALGPSILREEGWFSHNPLKPLATGSMAHFGFKHQGAQAPGVVFTGPEGEMTLARLEGKAVLVNIWASWCAPCVKEMPALDRLQTELGGSRFEVVAINMDQNADDALTFLAENKIRHLALYADPHLLMSIAFNEPGIPVSVLFDAHGKEVGRLVGPADWSSAESKALIAAAISPPSSNKIK